MMKPNEIRAVAHAGIASVIFIALATLASEESAAFKTFLTTTFGHHWVGKGALALLVFVLAYFFQRNRVSTAKVDLLALAWRVVFAVIISGAVIFAFFVWDAFKG